MSKTFDCYSFAGGVQRRTSKFLMKDEEVYFSQNADFEKVGAFKKRPGYTQFGSALATASSGLGARSFKKTDGNIYFYVVSGSDVYLYNSATGAYDAQSQGLTAGKKMDISIFGDYAFFTNGNDTPRTHNGSAWSQATMTTNAPTAFYNHPYNDRMYFGRTATNPSRLYYSSLIDAGVITWTTATDYIDIFPDDGSYIRGLGVQNDRLLIFKDHSLHTWDGVYNIVSLSHSVGTLSKDTIVNLGPYTFFLDRRGVYITQGGRPVQVSQKVYDYIEAMTTTQLEAAWAIADGDSYYLFIGAVNGLTNGMLKYNLIQDTWTIYELGDNFTVGCRHEVGGVEKAYACTNDGDVMKLWDGLTDDGTAVVMDVRTRWFWPSGPENFNNFEKIIVFSDYADSTKVYTQMSEDADFSATAIGTLNDEYSALNFTGRGRGIRYKFTDNATDERTEVHGFTQIYNPGEAL